MGHSLNWFALGIIFTILFIGTTVALPEADAQLADTSSITVHTVYSSGEIFGYYTVLSQGGVVQETDFSAATFTVNNGVTYNVEVQDSGDFKFDH